MTLFDFFQAEELPAPAVTADDARSIAKEHFGIDAQVTELGSQQDANFLLRDSSNQPIGVLKVANPAFSKVELEAQDAAASFISSAEPGVRTAVNVAPPGVPQIAELTATDGTALFARIIQFLPGGTMSGTDYLSPVRAAALGTLAGRTSRALADFQHPGVDRILQWDLQYAQRTVDLLEKYVDDPHRRAAVIAASAAAWQHVSAVAEKLPLQVIHDDITDDNVTCSSAEHGRIPDGIIDFGDLTRSWAVAELAITVSSILRHAGGEPAAAMPIIAAFHAVRPLHEAEIAALWPLVVMRAAVLVVSGNHQASIDADNDYATGALENEWGIFERATSVPSDVMTAQIRHVLGRGGSSQSNTAGSGTADSPLISEFEAEEIVLLDLSSESDAMDGGVWLTDAAESRLSYDEIDRGAAAVVTRFGEARITKSAVLSTISPATVATGVDIWLGCSAPLTAPWDCVIQSMTDDSLVLAGAPGTLIIRGGLTVAMKSGQSVTPSGGAAVSAGSVLATGSGHLWIQWIRPGVEASIDVPAFVRPEYSAGWLARVQDPSSLLGVRLPTTDAADAADEILWQRRARSYATVQEHYYLDPPRIERGWREHMVATDARSYLDMVNNVAILGHGHPVLADAVARQWRRLNTNSRFNYGAVVEFSERLAATLPDPLDTVFLVNSGSEAGDLALRLAMATTGRHDVVAVAEAYHGWTYATDAVSTSVADNPNALATRPSWIHTVPSPNAYRGTHRGVDALKYAPEAVKIIESLTEQGKPPAAFICEPFYGNAGGMTLPDGYLTAVYRAVRAAGGLAIADEVQVGYGRTGRWFWAFEQQEVIPDIVAVAKGMGNGQPLGAVITTRAIADAYRSQGYFFSSAGGSPVSSVVGLTVLDLLESEGLQQNALELGDHLKNRIDALADKHELIGTVHGSGLYMGIELVRDRETLEPAARETAAICERMRELGVIVQPTGDRQNILKVKPPLCLSRQSADFFVDILDQVLTTGW